METDIQDLARAHAAAAIAVLAEIMNNKDAPPSVRVSAAKTLLERAFGKVTAKAAKEKPSAQPITHITRTIIDPKRPGRYIDPHNISPEFFIDPDLPADQRERQEARLPPAARAFLEQQRKEEREHAARASS